MTASGNGDVRRAIPRNVAVAVASILLAFAAVFIITAITFAVAPNTLEPLGFRSNPAAWRRALGLAFMGGVGAILVHVAHGLLTNRASARSFIASLITAGVVWLIFELAEQ